ncbi:Rho-GAP domain-containing protein [Entamoeba marina]
MSRKSFLKDSKIKNSASATDFILNSLKDVEEHELFFKKQKELMENIVNAQQSMLQSFQSLNDLYQHSITIMGDSLLSTVASKTSSLTAFLGELFDSTNRHLTCDTETTLQEIVDVKTLLEKNKKKSTDSPSTIHSIVCKYEQNFQNKKIVTISRPLLSIDTFVSQCKTEFDSESVSNLRSVVDQCEIKSFNTTFPPGLYENSTLKEILTFEERDSHSIPLAVKRIFHQLRDNYLDVEGIFRLCGSSTNVDLYLKRMAVDTFEGCPCELLSSVVKKFVRDLPNNLINKNKTELLLKSVKEYGDIDGFKEFLKLLSDEELALTKSICKICHKVQLRQEENKMNSKNLSVCWTPSMFDVDAELAVVTNLMEKIFTNYPTVFSEQINTQIMLSKGEITHTTSGNRNSLRAGRTSLTKK